METHIWKWVQMVTSSRGKYMDNIFEDQLICLVFLLKRRCIKHVSLLSPYPGGEDYLQQLQEMGGGARGACHQHHGAATRHGEDTFVELI